MSLVSRIHAGNSTFKTRGSKLAGDETKVEAEHEQRKEHDGERNPHRQCPHGALSLSLVLDEKVEGGKQARDDEDYEKYDENFHVRGRCALSV